MTIDPRYTVTFGQSIILNNSDNTLNSIGNQGEIRYNKYIDRLQVYHRNTDFAGSTGHWHQIESNIATTNSLGIIKVGNNLTITEDGILSSIAAGVSRIYQNIITIASSNSSAADYNTIEFAITNALGTYTSGYSDGIITSINGPPSIHNRYVLLCSPGYYYPTEQIILPPYTSLEGDDKNNTVIYFYTSNIDTYTNKNCIETTNISSTSGFNTFKNLTFTLELNSNTNNTYNIIQNQHIIPTTRKEYHFDNIIINDITTLTTPYSTESEFIGISIFDASNVNITNSTVNFNYEQCIAVNLLNNSNINIQNTELKCNITPDNNIYSSQLITGIYTNLCDNVNINNSYINITDNSNISTNLQCNLYGINSDNDELLNISSSTIETIYNQNKDFTYSNTSNINSINIITSTELLPSITNSNVSITHDTTNNNYICDIDSIVPSDLIDGNQTILFRGFTGNYTDNNTYFHISGGNSSVLIFNANSFQPIITSTEISSINIYKLRQININNSIIKSSKYLINEYIDNSLLPLSIPPVIISGGCNVFKSGTINTPNYITTFNYPSIINVSNDASSTFQTISQALEYITDSSINRQYIIQIQPGKYYEQSPIICKSFVNITSIDPKNTTIYIANDPSVSTNTIPQIGIQLVSGIILTGLNIIATAIYNSVAHNYNLFDIDNVDNVIIKDCSVVLNINCDSLNINANNTGYVLNTNSSTNIKFDNVYMEIKSVESSDISSGILDDTNFFVINSTNNTTNNSLININSSTLINNVHYNKFESNTTSNANIGVIINTLSNINIQSSYLSTCIDISTGTDNTNYYGIYANTSPNTNRCYIEIWDSIIQSKEITLYFATGNNTTIIANNCNLISRDNIANITNKPIDPTSILKCNNCYYFFNNIYKSLNSAGQYSQGDGNLSLDDSAGNQYFTTGHHNTSLGINAGSNITTGNDNTLIGYSSGLTLIDSSNCSYIGSLSGPINNNSNGIGNTSLGSLTLNNITSGSNNTVIGFSTASSLTTGNNNIITGLNGADSLINGNNNILTGRIVASNLTDGNMNIITGDNAGANLTHGNNNILIGSNVAANSSIATTYSNTVIIGTNAGFNNTSNELISIGLNSGMNNTVDGINNIFIGSNAGMNNTIGDDNTIIGQYSGESQTTANKTTIIGSHNMGGYNGSGEMTVIGVNNIPLDGCSTNKSVVMGINNMPLLDNGSNLIILGNNNASNMITSNSVIILGSNALISNESNSSYIVIGNDSANEHLTGESIIIGHQAGINSTGEKLMVMGHQAGSGVDGKLNTYIGYKSGFLYNSNDQLNGDKTGDYNLFIGPYTGFNLSSGSRNVVVGSGDINSTTGFSITSGSGNTIFGYGSGTILSSSDNNTLIGSNVAPKLHSGGGNLIFGHSAGHNLESGINNIIIGYEAEGSTNASDIDNVIAIGYQAGYNNYQDNQIFMGTQAGYNTLDGPQNIYIGYHAGYSAVSASNNIFLGTEAGFKAKNNAKNICIGYNAGYGATGSNFTSDNNILIGNEAGYSIAAQSDNIMIGNKAGHENYDGGFNIFMGKNSGSKSSTNYSILIGNSSEGENKGIGYNSSGDNLISIGLNAGLENVSGYDNINIGHSAAKNNTSGAKNIIIGFSAGENSDNCENSIKIGSYAGQNTTASADNTIFIGFQAGQNTTSAAEKTIAIGSNAGLNTNSAGSIYIGTDAGSNTTDGSDNINIGYNSAKNNITGSKNIAIGPYTLQDCSDDINNIIAIGSYAASNTESNNCIMIGSNAGVNNTTGTESIYIGINSGSGNTLSSYNIGIGNNTLSTLNANLNSLGGDIAIGHNAGSNIGKSFNNIISINSNASPYNNTIIGYSALSQGDISSNNIVFGSRAAEFVNNPAEFANNIITGANAAKYSNNSVNSIIIGANTNTEGSGGQYNILIGANSGQLIGNPNEVYYNLKDETQTVNANYANLAVTFENASQNIKYGSGILFTDNKAWFRSNVVALYPIDSGGNTQVIFDSRLPTNYSFSPASHTNVAITSNIYDKYGFGRNDVSIAGESIIIGTTSANNLTSGSKNTSVGAQTMISNEIGKYNNIFGARAGYYVQTDNNTCIGTQAGASIDYYLDTDENTVYTSSDYVFESNTNSISSITQTFSEFVQGTVFDVLNSNSNNGRYNISSITSNTISNIIIVEGFPKIQDDGVTNTIPSGALTIIPGPFIFLNESLTSTNIDFGVSYPDTITGSRITINSYIANTNLENAKVIQVNGSKYNDGIYYIYYTDTSISGKLVIYLYGFTSKETVGNSITIKSISIQSITTTYLTDIYNYDLIPYNAPIYVYFDKYKGQYKKTIQSSVINPSSIYINGLELNETNINWTSSTRNDNKIYINGQGFYNSNIYNYGNSGSRLVNIYDNNIKFFASNNNIVFSNNINANILATSGSYSATNTYFKIKGTLNNNILVKIIDITDNVINCDSSTSILTDEIYNGSVNPLIFDRDNIYVSGANNILSSGKIFTLSQLYKSSNDAFYQPYNFINNVLNGMFITDSVNNNVIKATSNYPTYPLISGTTPYGWSYADTNWQLTNTSASYINSPTISFHTTEITNINIDISTTNKTITANIATSNDFRNIIAPTMIKLSNASTNNGYYLIDSNPYPFRTLYLHRESSFNGSNALNVISNINVNSISNYSQNSNIANILTPNTEYTVIGSKNNNEIIFTTGDATTISPYSAYVTGNLSNDSWDGNNFNYLPVIGTYNSLYRITDNFYYGVQGSFKNIEFTIGGNGSNNVQFISSSSTIIITTDNTTKKTCLDQFLTQDFFRTYKSSSSNNKLYRITSRSVSVGTTNVYSFVVEPSINDEYDVNYIYSIRMNEFRSIDTKYNVRNGGVTTLDYKPLYNYIGVENFKYLNLSIETSEITTSTLTSTTKTYSSHNYSVDYNSYTSYTINPYPTSYTPSISYFVVSLIETCTTNYYDDPTNTINTISISIGVPTTYVNQYYTNSAVYPDKNIHTSGYTSMIADNSNNMSFKLRYTGPSNEPYYDMTANIEINSLTKIIGLSNITIIQNQIKEPTDIYGNHYNPYSNPFNGLVKGVIYNITSTIPIIGNNYSFIFDGINSSNSYQIYYKDTTYNSIGNLPTLNSYYVSNVSIEFKNYSGILNERINLSNIGGATSSENSLALYLTKYESTYPIFPTNISGYVSGLFDNSNASSSFLPVTSGVSLCNSTYISQGFNTLIFKSTDITNTSQTHIYFSNISITDATLTFNNSTHTITSTNPITANIAIFNASQYIQLSNSAISYKEYFLISTTSPTSSTIIIDPNYSTAVLPANGIYTIKSHTINSSEIATDDLSVFNPGQKIIISKTTNNNRSVIIEKATYNNPYSLYIDDSTSNIIITETPEFCTLERSVIIDENGSSSVELKQIGQPLSGTVNSQLVKYHYEDAEGNNLMIGSFAGNYCGRLTQSIYNTYIGAKVGQVNHGSGNIFLGNESGFAPNELEGATYYNNKLAIYKNNSIGISANPLIGGDFVSNRIGINTIDPDSYVSGTINETDTKLVINGKARAYAFSSFTGVHDITLSMNLQKLVKNGSIQKGMILISSGKVQKPDIINTIVECDLPDKDNDKRVYGLYVGLSENNIYSVASVGEGCIWVCNANGNIENGDYISSCGTQPGYGMRQEDDLMHSYTVAKATENVEWDPNISGVQYALIGCTYHCG